MCKVLRVPRSSYYKYINKSESLRSIENRMFEASIINIYEESKKRYGAPKIHKLLNQQGHKISLKRVQRIMKQLGIKSITVKKFKPHPSKNKVDERDNILKRNFTTTDVDEKWATDIIYIYTIQNSWCYLASVMDLCSKKIIGYAFSKTMDTDMAIKAVSNAIKEQKPSKGLILHSDLGSQYTSKKFKEFVSKSNIIHSFSGKGNPYDNACIESFHATLKKEEVNQTTYYNYNPAKLAIFEYIESWYNRKRIHSSIGYFTPQQYEDQLKYA